MERQKMMLLVMMVSLGLAALIIFLSKMYSSVPSWPAYILFVLGMGLGLLTQGFRGKTAQTPPAAEDKPAEPKT